MRIVAPFDGTLGIRNVNLGDYVKTVPIWSIWKTPSALYVDFRLPERYQGRWPSGRTVKVELDAPAGPTHQAKVVALDPLVDANVRSLAGAGLAAFRKPAQPSGVQPLPLRPGMFARTTTVFSVTDEGADGARRGHRAQGANSLSSCSMPKAKVRPPVAHAQGGGEAGRAPRRHRCSCWMACRRATPWWWPASSACKDGTVVRVVDLAAQGPRKPGGVPGANKPVAPTQPQPGHSLRAFLKRSQKPE